MNKNLLALTSNYCLMNYWKGLVFALCAVLTVNLKSQIGLSPEQHVSALASYNMQGRGYVKNGDEIAANYIRKQFYTYGTKPLTKDYYQRFSFPINTFPGKMQIALGKQSLKPVYDFVIAPESKAKKGTFPIHYLPLAADTIDAIYDSISKIDYSGKFVAANFNSRNIRKQNPFNASGVLLPKKSVYWWASTAGYETDITTVMLVDSLLNNKPQYISVDFDSKFLTNYKTQNVAAFVEGSVKPDSFIVFSAHYDHLGWMGKGNVFLGANDNASGTAMVLWLAEYFSKPENRPDCSVVFLLFAAEETGLHGSRFFTENPLIDLSNIKVLINLDMVGSGSDGIAIVNGEANKPITSVLDTINAANKYFTNIKIRGESCSSDHCYFHKAGVPSVFIYTMGNECKEYHNLKDTPQNTPLTKFNELRELLIAFTNEF